MKSHEINNDAITSEQYLDIDIFLELHMRRGLILLHGFIAVRDLKLVSQSENDFKSSRILKLWNNIRFLIPEFLGSTKITEIEPKFRKIFCSVTLSLCEISHSV